MGDLNNILNIIARKKVNLGTFTFAADENGVSVTAPLVLTKDQIIAKYMQMQDPTLSETFTKTMLWTSEIQDAVTNSLSSQEKAWAEHLLETYQGYYDRINEVYKRHFGVNLPRNPFYSPIRRDFTTDKHESLLAYQDYARYASASNGSLIARTNNLQSLKFNGALETIINHVVQMEHFIAWADTMSDLRGVFGNKETRKNIKKYHGEDVLHHLDGYINDMARAGVDQSKITRAADTIRRNFTVYAIEKPNVLLKQIPSVLLYMTEMSVKDFGTGTFDFWRHPIKNYNTIKENSPALKERFSRGGERDLNFANQKKGVAKLTNKANIRDWFTWHVKLGDRFAVMQGAWAVFKSVKKEKGVTDAQAWAKVERITERTQPSFTIESLSPIQKNHSIVKLLTMFMNQRNKFFRIIADSARNYQYNRGSRPKNAMNIVQAWVIAPVMFQFFADGLRFEPEHVARAAILGGVNNLLIFGELLNSAYGWLTGEHDWDWEATPVFQTADDIMRALQKVNKMATNNVSFWDEFKMEDFTKFIEYTAKAAGAATGYPTQWPYMVHGAIKDRDIMRLIYSEYTLEQGKNIPKSAPETDQYAT